LTSSVGFHKGVFYQVNSSVITIAETFFLTAFYEMLMKQDFIKTVIIAKTVLPVVMPL